MKNIEFDRRGRPIEMHALKRHSLMGSFIVGSFATCCLFGWFIADAISQDRSAESTAQVSELTNEAAELSVLAKEAHDAIDEHRHAAAIQILGKILAARLDKHGEQHEESVDTIFQLAEQHAWLGNVESSEKLTLRALSITGRLSQKQPWRKATGDVRAAHVRRLQKLDAETKGKLKRLTETKSMVRRLVREWNAPEAKQLVQSAVKLTENVLGVDDPETLHWQLQWSVLMSIDGKSEKAAELREKTLRRLRLLYGDDSPALADRFSLLAALCLDAGLFSNSIQYNKAAVKALQGASLAKRNTALERLCYALSKASQFEEENNHLQELLKLRETNHGSAAPESIFVIRQLATNAKRRNDWLGAERWQRLAVERETRNSGPGSLQHEKCVLDLSRTLVEQAKFDQAKDLLFSLLKQVRSGNEPSGNAVNRILSRLIDVCRRQGEGLQAKSLEIELEEFRKNIRANAAKSRNPREQPLSPDQIKNAMNYMGLFYKARRLQSAGKEAMAVEAYEAAVAYAQKEIPMLADSALKMLAPLYTNLRQFQKARAAWEVVIEGYRKEGKQTTLSDARIKLREVETLSALTSKELDQLARAFEDYGKSLQLESANRFQESLPIAKRVLKTRESILGNRHIDTVLSLRHVGWLTSRLGDDEAAVPYYRRSLEVATKLAGNDHYLTKAAFQNLDRLNNDRIATFLKDGNFRVALSINERVIQTRRRYYGDTDYRVRDAELRQKDLTRLVDASPAERRRFLEIGNKLSSLRQRDIDATQAVEGLRELLQECQKEFGLNHAITAKTTSALGSAYNRIGDFRNALATHRLALERNRQLLGESHLETAISLSNVALAYKNVAQWARSVRYFERAKLAYQSIKGDFDGRVASQCRAIGQIHQKMGAYEKAKQAFDDARQIYSRMESRRKAAKETLYGIPVYMDQANQPKGQFYVNLDLAKLEADRGNPHARMKFKGLVGQAEKIFGVDDLETAQVMYHVAEFRFASGEYTTAGSLLRSALAIQKQAASESPQLVAPTIDLLGRTLVREGREDAGLQLIKRAYALRLNHYGPSHPNTAKSYRSLGLVLLRQGQIQSAADYLKQSLQIQVGNRQPNGMHIGSALADYGYALLAAGRSEEAKQHFNRARDIIGDLRPPWHADSIRAARGLALTEFASGNVSEARWILEEILKESTALLTVNVRNMSEMEAVAYLARLRELVGPYLSCLEALGLPDTKLAYYPIWELKSRATRARFGTHLVFKSDEWDGQPAGLAKAKESWTLLQKCREQLASLSQVPIEAKGELARARKLRRLSDQKAGLEQIFMVMNSLHQLHRDDAQAGFADLARRLSDDVAIVDFLLIDRIVRNPDNKSIELRPHYQAFVLRKGQDDQLDLTWVSLPAQELVDKLVLQFRRSIGRVSTDAASFNGQSAIELKKATWNRLAPDLVGAKTVILLPDGLLSQVPWAALPGRDDKGFLIEEFALATALNGQHVFQLLNTQRQPVHIVNKGDSLLVVGGVDYDRPPRGSSSFIAGLFGQREFSRSPIGLRGTIPKWNALPGTKREIAKIKDIWNRPRQTVELTDDKATESLVKKQMANHRFIHLSTHGYFTNRQNQPVGTREDGNAEVQRESFGRNPLLLSGIVLTGANHPFDENSAGLDGYLTGEEVLTVDLSKNELCVLAACETGLGEVANGEGVFGLQRAFHLAGTPRVIGSLWKVNDAATQALMAEFYKNMWKGNMTVLTALREAQLSMINGRLNNAITQESRALGIPTPLKKGTRSADPYLWAAFSLSGDWR